MSTLPEDKDTRKNTYLTVHLLTDITNIGKDGLLVSFLEQLGRGDGVSFLAGGGEEGGVGGV